MTLRGRTNLVDDDGTGETGTAFIDEWWQTDLWLAIETTINQSSITLSTSNQNITVAGLSACIAHVYDATTGKIATIQYQVGVTPVTIVSQVGSTFVTGAPGATEIQITESSSRLVAKGGSSRSGDTLRVTYFPL